MVDFRTNLDPKVTRSRQSGALRGPRHPQGAPRRVQELPFGTQTGAQGPFQSAKGTPDGALGATLASIWGALGALWVTFGIILDISGRHAATFRVKRLNHGKPRILLEKRGSGGHGGGQGVVILGVLGQKTCPKSTQGRPKRAKRHTKTRRRGSRGHWRGQRGAQGPPREKK